MTLFSSVLLLLVGFALGLGIGTHAAWSAVDR